MRKRSARPARDGRRLLMALVLIVAALTLVLFVSACGSDDNGDNGAKTDSAETEAGHDDEGEEHSAKDEMLESMSASDKEHEASEPVDGHFNDAMDELDKGNKSMMIHHLVGAVLAAEKQNMPGAEKEADEALEAADENDLEAAKKHIKAGLKEDK